MITHAIAEQIQIINNTNKRAFADCQQIIFSCLNSPHAHNSYPSTNCKMLQPNSCLTIHVDSEFKIVQTISKTMANTHVCWTGPKW